MKSAFSSKSSATVKGLAVIFLLIHHLLNSKYPFTSLLVGDEYDYLAPLVSSAKVCVYLFLLISGYGLYLSYSKQEDSFDHTLRFVLRHIVKLYSMYWIIYIIFVPMGLLFGRSPADIYSSWTDAIWDILGLAYLHGTPSIINTWWYNSMIILFYVAFPVAFFILRRLNGYTTLAGLALLSIMACLHYGWKVSLIYCVPFVIGMVCAKYQLFDRAKAFCSETRTRRFFKLLVYLSVLAAYEFYRFRVMLQNQFPYRLDWIQTLLWICLVYEYLPENGVCAKSLQLIGKHSGNIYLFHSFIYGLYAKDLLYSLKYPVLIVPTALISFVFVSILLEKVKQIIGYQKLFDLTLKRIGPV